MKFTPLWLCALAACVPLAATAQDARSTKWVNLRAGPARDYPLVERLQPDTPLSVQGCTPGYGWCDVIGPYNVRGWVYAANIVFPYQGTQAPVLDYGEAIGFPVVPFAIGSYWGQFYSDRPWFGTQPRWAGRPPIPPQGWPQNRLRPRPAGPSPILFPPRLNGPGRAGPPNQGRQPPRRANPPPGGSPGPQTRPAPAPAPAARPAPAPRRERGPVGGEYIGR